jgi:hypothetical protein
LRVLGELAELERGIDIGLALAGFLPDLLDGLVELITQPLKAERLV